MVVDVLAKLINRPDQLAFTAAGMVADLAGMLAIRQFAGDNRDDGSTSSLVVAIVTDIVVDGRASAAGPG